MLLHPKQKEIVKSKARFKVIRAGRRSGKSSVSIEIMLFTAVSKANTNVFYIAPTQKQARSIIWESLKTRLGGVGEANESRLEMRIPTKDGGFSTIYIAGFENRENFRGMKAHLIVFDELDTMRDFFVGWQEIFRPALTDTAGKALFIGTPKKENPNLRRLEKLSETDSDYQKFHFTTQDNPHVPIDEINKAKDELDYSTFKQEYLAEYVENSGSLFKQTAILDIFSNTVSKNDKRYLIVDVADDGTDKTVFSYWEGLEEVWRQEFERLNTENIIAKIREYASQYRIPYSHIAVDAIGVGSAVSSSSMLDGIIGYKSSYGAIRTERSIITLPNVGYLNNAPLVTEYKNLRSQCVFKLSELVNNHKIASRVTGQFKEMVIDELIVYQDVSTGDGKRMATKKEDVKAIVGRSPDHSDCFIMRMYFEIIDHMLPQKDETKMRLIRQQEDRFNINRLNSGQNSTK